MTDFAKNRLRYGLLGAGSRSQMYLDAIAGPHRDVAQLVAWSDTNPGRLDFSEHWEGRDLGEPARFDPADLETAIAAFRLDRVIITTPDFTHADYIVRALDAGADVVVEKPLTISQEGVRAIGDAVERTGRNVVVTFNYRYSPRNWALKRLIADQAIGEVTSVHFEWLLDTAHGADYFRRWHREKDMSGGLLIHKASHHFDLVNWWLDDVPTKVYASGGLRFYGAENARARGLAARPARGTTDLPSRDAFSLDLRTDPIFKGLYYEQEHHDGYLRDRDVFDEGITIEDNMSLVVDYQGGASMAYTLSAHGPWEGYTVTVNGTAGRAELTVVERGAVALDEAGYVVVDPSARPDVVVDDGARAVSEKLLLQKHFASAVEIPIPEGVGAHGGADDDLLREVFRGPQDDVLGRASGWPDGVRAVAVGLAGNASIDTGNAIRIEELEIGHAAALSGLPSRTLSGG